MDDILLYKDESLSKIFNDKKHLINEYSNLNIEGISVESQTKFGNNNLIYNDYNHPICYTDFMKKPSILINETFFNLHREDMNSLVIELIKRHSGKISIDSSCLINDDVITAIASNPNITQVTLGSYIDKYVLNKKDYDKLNNGTIKGIDTEDVSDELKDNFDGIIYYNLTRNLISRYN